MVKEKNIANPQRPSIIFFLVVFSSFIFILFLIFLISGIYFFEKTYKSKIYPGVRIDGENFGGRTSQEVENYFVQKSQPFKQLKITLGFEDKIATLSSKELAISFDGKLSGLQAYSIGRSGHILSDVYQKWRSIAIGINLPSVLKKNTDFVDDTLNRLATTIDYPYQDALFQFEKGKVTLFQPSKLGRELDKTKTKQMIDSYIITFSRESSQTSPQDMIINLPVQTLIPRIATENSNNFGIKELLGVGSSRFVGSIAGRIHNIILATSRINGHLIPPGSVFSFNDTLGDVSASTGFQPAYIIKNGRTVLGDGGGVCQVSTTTFRAALNSGLPIVERHPHAYRVSYYEQDSSPGLDATVFAPSYDLKFKNDTLNYILIQTKTDLQNYSLTFEIYGTSDGRKSEVTKPIISSQTPPPPDLYQDDPTLPRGIVKQVDWKAWGAKVNFDYKVIYKDGTTTTQSFFSNFQPWQTVYLKGIRD